MTDLDYLIFSLHALDRMTQRAIRVGEVRQALDKEGPTSFDLDGNHRYDAAVDGRSIRVVVSADNPLFVITVYLLAPPHEPGLHLRSVC